MTHAPIQFSPDAPSEGRLLCPACDGDYVHIDEVHVGGRTREDGEWVPVVVNHQGQVEQGARNLARPISGGDRRHFITLVGWCELCGAHFGFAFNQHKGRTLVSAVEAGWKPVERRTPGEDG